MEVKRGVNTTEEDSWEKICKFICSFEKKKREKVKAITKKNLNSVAVELGKNKAIMRRL